MRNGLFQTGPCLAFTLVEIIVVIVIIGIVAAFALPRFTGTNEKVVCSEASAALSTLRSSQARYNLENGSYVGTVGGGSCASLDIDVTLNNFDTLTCFSSGNVSLTRTGGGYTVTISPAGVYTCPACTGAVKSACNFQ